MMARPVPKRIYGIRLPIFVLVLSDKEPNNGRRIKARILSAAMIAPE